MSRSRSTTYSVGGGPSSGQTAAQVNALIDTRRKVMHTPLASDIATYNVAPLKRGDIVISDDDNVQHTFDGVMLNTPPASLGSAVLHTPLAADIATYDTSALKPGDVIISGDDKVQHTFDGTVLNTPPAAIPEKKHYYFNSLAIARTKTIKPDQVVVIKDGDSFLHIGLADSVFDETDTVNFSKESHGVATALFKKPASPVGISPVLAADIDGEKIGYWTDVETIFEFNETLPEGTEIVFAKTIATGKVQITINGASAYTFESAEPSYFMESVVGSVLFKVQAGNVLQLIQVFGSTSLRALGMAVPVDVYDPVTADKPEFPVATLIYEKTIIKSTYNGGATGTITVRTLARDPFWYDITDNNSLFEGIAQSVQPKATEQVFIIFTVVGEITEITSSNGAISEITTSASLKKYQIWGNSHTLDISGLRPTEEIYLLNATNVSGDISLIRPSIYFRLFNAPSLTGSIDGLDISGTFTISSNNFVTGSLDNITLQPGATISLWNAPLISGSLSKPYSGTVASFRNLPLVTGSYDTHAPTFQADYQDLPGVSGNISLTIASTKVAHQNLSAPPSTVDTETVLARLVAGGVSNGLVSLMPDVTITNGIANADYVTLAGRGWTLIGMI